MEDVAENRVQYSRRQLADCPGNGLIEVNQTPAAHATTERDAYVCAGNPEFEIFFLIEPRILRVSECHVQDNDCG